MEQIVPVLLQGGLSGAAILILLFVARQLWSDGKDKDKALLAEKDARISDTRTSFQTLADGLRTVETAIKIVQSGGRST